MVTLLTGSLGGFLDRHYESQKVKTLILANTLYGKHGGPYQPGSAIGLLFVGIALEEMLIGFVAFLAVFAGGIAYARLVARGTGPTVKEITDHKVVIQIPSDKAADAIEARLGLGAAAAKPLPGEARDPYERQLDRELADLH